MCGLEDNASMKTVRSLGKDDVGIPLTTVCTCQKNS